MSSIGATTGLKALYAAQLSLQTAGHNIANAHVPGYSRQSVLLTTDHPVNIAGIGFLGTGVKASGIIRTADQMLEARIQNQNQGLGRLGKETMLLSQIEDIFNEPGEGGLATLYSKFFSSLNDMSLDPIDSTLRSDVIIAGDILGDGFANLARNLTSFKEDIEVDIRSKVSKINSMANQIAVLNEKITIATNMNAQANELIDKRNQIVKELNYITSAQLVENNNGQSMVLVDGRILAGSDYTHELVYSTDLEGKGNVHFKNDPTSLNIRDGELNELLNQQTSVIPNLMDKLDTMASQMIWEFNKIHSTGVPLSGPFSVLKADNLIMDLDEDGDARNDALAYAGLPFTPTAGSLFVTVTNLTTGAMEQHEIVFDPERQNLNDLTSQLSSISHLGAYADTQGQLTIHSGEGYGFDFSTQLDPDPNKTNSFGTVEVAMEGSYTGASNTSYRFDAVGAGTIGVTPNLSIEVYDETTGHLVTVLNVGQNYSPGEMIEVENGVKVSFSPGDIDQAAGDSFSAKMLADPDEGGLLASMGLNTFFKGTKAKDISIMTKLQENPDLICGALSSTPGDNSNIIRMTDLESTEFDGLGKFTIIDYYSSVIGKLGLDKEWADDMFEVQQDLMMNLENQRASISGVSIDEEMLNLEKYQQMLQAATQYLQVMNEVMDSILTIV